MEIEFAGQLILAAHVKLLVSLIRLILLAIILGVPKAEGQARPQIELFTDLIRQRVVVDPFCLVGQKEIVMGRDDFGFHIFRVPHDFLAAAIGGVAQSCGFGQQATVFKITQRSAAILDRTDPLGMLARR